MRSIPLQAGPQLGPLRSRRLLALAGDDRLVTQLRLGNDAAFEVAFERHGPGILSFCRHMLGSREEAEDVVQHTFAAAHRALLGEEREITLKPWLYAIARNRCLSLLRMRREQPLESHEPSTAGLAEEVERRADLRDLLADLADLPAEQRAALLLAEVADLSHAEAAEVLECEAARVKALVYRARQGLLERRDARAAPCEEIRRQLASLRGGALRRTELRHHLRVCPGCRSFREQVKQQRGMLAVALPAAPSLGLKSAVLGAVGLGGGSAGGAGALAALGASGTAKLAIVGALAGGGLVAGEAAVQHGSPARAPDPPATVVTPRPPTGIPGAAQEPASPTLTREPGIARSEKHAPRGERGRGVAQARTRAPGAAPVPTQARGHGPPNGSPKSGSGKAPDVPAAKARGRGPVIKPPAVPVRRGPPAERGRPDVSGQGRSPKPAEAVADSL